MPFFHFLPSQGFGAFAKLGANLSTMTAFSASSMTSAGPKTEADLERAKTEMDPTTVKEVNINGYKSVEGLITGPKNRYITIILKDNKLFSVSTLPPTEENKSITQQILTTFQFN